MEFIFELLKLFEYSIFMDVREKRW